MDRGFGKRYRLLKTEEFSSVFALRRLNSKTAVQVWQMPNGLPHPRLGLAVPKKTAKRANRRNYMKRAVREWFRLNRHRLAANDIVVRVRQPFNAAGRAEVWRQLDQAVEHKHHG
ncbi:ribonuclease P protein component [Neisseria shayeganii]|uniref:Ribonuclease P protein component n=1 Tax=Neisseria shayeganii TaxID=607712 RepID=A0A7D7T5C7_9NEIS|nr:ribonuclease P protein component [Neisseria shayeganii]QMT39933.1 ribonuclease P protein component [Neisseria shayeganii]